MAVSSVPTTGRIIDRPRRTFFPAFIAFRYAPKA